MNILPCGSVVKIRDKAKKTMIICHKPSVAKKAVFDYGGIDIPQGFVNDDEVVLFDSDQIEKVIFEGYKYEEVEDYLDDIKWLEEKIKNE